MGKNYRRHRRRSMPQLSGACITLILLGLIGLKEFWLTILTTLLAIGLVVLLIILYRNKIFHRTKSIKPDAPVQSANHPTTDEAPHRMYLSKESFMTEVEKQYFNAFKKILGPEYIIQPQINLASIISKETQNRYRNELFRNIDFGVFDKNYTLKFLIEINDQTHSQKTRMMRDKKVNSICDEAGIPLITFWTKYGVNETYIRKRFSDYIQVSVDSVNKEISKN